MTNPLSGKFDYRKNNNGIFIFIIHHAPYLTHTGGYTERDIFLFVYNGATHSYNIVIFIHDIFFSVYVNWEIFLLYTYYLEVQGQKITS